MGVFENVTQDSNTVSNSDLDSKTNSYIVLCRIYHIIRSQIQIPILTANYRNGIGGIGTRIGIRICECK